MGVKNDYSVVVGRCWLLQEKDDQSFGMSSCSCAKPWPVRNSLVAGDLGVCKRCKSAFVCLGGYYFVAVVEQGFLCENCGQRTYGTFYWIWRRLMRHLKSLASGGSVYFGCENEKGHYFH